MDTIVVNNVEIRFADNIPAEQKGNAIAFAMEFVNSTSNPIEDAYVRMLNGKFKMDYREKVGNDEIDHMNFINENGEEEDFKIICHGGWGEEEEEPYTPPASTPAYPDKSQEILKAMEKVAHQTERVADQLWWQSFNNSL